MEPPDEGLGVIAATSLRVVLGQRGVIRSADGCRAGVAGMLKALKGQAPALLRHPSGAAVIDDAFTAASAAQRNAMAAEFYGREFTLFEARSLYFFGLGW